jgi:LPXTG-motif cell wall-anchored protein
MLRCQTGLTVSLIACGLVLFPIASVPAIAACPTPEISLSRSSGSAGVSVVVTGKFWASGCNDTSVNGQTPQPEPAQKDIVIRFVQGQRSWKLATVDANSSYKFRVVVHVPSDAKDGSASVRAQGEQTITKPFRVQGSELPATGASPSWFALAGLLLLALGVAPRFVRSTQTTLD